MVFRPFLEFCLFPLFASAVHIRPVSCIQPFEAGLLFAASFYCMAGTAWQGCFYIRLQGVVGHVSFWGEASYTGLGALARKLEMARKSSRGFWQEKAWPGEVMKREQNEREDRGERGGKKNKAEAI